MFVFSFKWKISSSAWALHENEKVVRYKSYSWGFDDDLKLKIVKKLSWGGFNVRLEADQELHSANII